MTSSSGSGFPVPSKLNSLCLNIMHRANPKVCAPVHQLCMMIRIVLVDLKLRGSTKMRNEKGDLREQQHPSYLTLSKWISPWYSPMAQLVMAADWLHSRLLSCHLGDQVEFAKMVPQPEKEGSEGYKSMLFERCELKNLAYKVDSLSSC